ncbi:MAG TPA: PP2C family serine/threonine-protein phosphatase, partial [Gemmataceae bacterium]|nr:PP2C family serine/threonine-protein phosphatase [Gemmataceae bacterium]
PRPTGPQWKYVPVPPTEPDPHPESDALERMTPEEGRLIAARVRGKKHKHEGTNCDDWYEIGTAGPWTVIAVSDGAGSKRLSRVGAKVSCQEAVRQLTAALADHRLQPRGPDCARKDAQHAAFLDPDVEFVQKKMHEAFQGAYIAVEKAWRERVDDLAYAKLLTRKLVVEDLSGTLLVAAHTTVRVQGREQSLVVSCQIGDGVTAGLDPRGVVVVLGAADSGDYSGETDFLTSRRQLEPANLQRKTFGFVGPLRALLVMTDGVADDYFPADPGMARLYADLVLNGVLPPAVHVGEEALAEAGEHMAPNFDPSSLDTESEAVTANGPVRVMLRSAATYASELGRDVCRIAGDPAFLTAGARNAPLAPASPKHCERLRLWLDAYQVRGSFDDRTMVVLHHERAG